jgi:hypothetical protein
MRTPAPSPVSGIASAGAAVRQVQQDLNTLLDDVVTFLTADAGDEPNAAGVVLMRRIVETLGGRQAGSRVLRFLIHLEPVVVD